MSMLWIILQEDILEVKLKPGPRTALLLMLKYMSTLSRIIPWNSILSDRSLCCGFHCVSRLWLSPLLSLGHPLPKQYLIDTTAALSPFAVRLDEGRSGFREAFQVEGAAACVKACRHTRSVCLGKYWIV